MFGQSGEKANYIGIMGLKKDLVLSITIYRKIRSSGIAQEYEDPFSKDSERPGFYDQGLR